MNVQKFMNLVAAYLSELDYAPQLIDHNKIEVETDCGQTSILTHEMAGTRDAGDPQFRVRVGSTIEDASLINLMAGHEAQLNRSASLGALIRDGDSLSVVSQCPLKNLELNKAAPIVATSALMAAPSIVNCARVILGDENFKLEKQSSNWNIADFEYVSNNLAKEFDEVEFDTHRLIGIRYYPHEEYKFLLHAMDMHPGIGHGGLMVQISFKNGSLDCPDRQVCINALNTECFLYDDVPLLGAWFCDQGFPLAYVSFLPNSFKDIPGITEDFSKWALARGDWVISGEAELRVREFITTQKSE